MSILHCTCTKSVGCSRVPVHDNDYLWNIWNSHHIIDHSPEERDLFVAVTEAMVTVTQIANTEVDPCPPTCPWETVLQIQALHHSADSKMGRESGTN